MKRLTLFFFLTLFFNTLAWGDAALIGEESVHESAPVGGGVALPTAEFGAATLWHMKPRAVQWGNSTFFIYLGWDDGDPWGIWVAEYDSVANEWNTYDTGWNTVHNTHGTATMDIRSDGYLQISVGLYNSVAQLLLTRRSTNIGDASAWESGVTVRTQASSWFTYPLMEFLDTNDNAVIVYLRTLAREYRLKTSTDKGSTWAYDMLLIDNVYAGGGVPYVQIATAGDRLYVVWHQFDDGDDEHRGFFLVYSDNATAASPTWYAMDGTEVTSLLPFINSAGSELDSGSLTIGLTYEITAQDGEDFTADGAADNNVGTRFTATGTSVTLDANDKVIQIYDFLVFDSVYNGWDNCYIGAIQHFDIDGDSIPHIVFGLMDSVSTDQLMHAKWNGSSWDINTVDTSNDLFNNASYATKACDADILVVDENNISIVMSATVSGQQEIVEYVSDDGGDTWGGGTQLTSGGTDDHVFPIYPREIDATKCKILWLTGANAHYNSSHDINGYAVAPAGGTDISWEYIIPGDGIHNDTSQGFEVIVPDSGVINEGD